MEGAEGRQLARIHPVPVERALQAPHQARRRRGQKRSFTFIDDAIEALITILENKNSRATRRIFNIGNPTNSISIRDLAERTIRIAQEFPVLRENAKATQVVDVSAGEYYGKYYQDIQVRVPAIEAAKRDLGWAPTTDMDTAIRRTIDYYVKLGELQRPRLAPRAGVNYRTIGMANRGGADTLAGSGGWRGWRSRWPGSRPCRCG